MTATTKAPADISAILSIAGQWTPAPGTNVALITQFGNGPISPNGSDGIVVGGWAFNGVGAIASAITPTLAVAFQQDAQGIMHLQPSSFFGSAAQTNGTGSVQITDFNGDGIADIFLGAHNESPKQTASSVAFISTPAGYQRVQLNDAVEAHSTALAIVDGKPTVFAGTFNATGDLHPEYQWNGSGFSVIESPHVNVTGESVAVADFNHDGNLEAVFGNSNFGPGLPLDLSLNAAFLYKLPNGDITELQGPPVVLPAPYFANKPQFAQLPSFFPEQTEQYHVAAPDLNGDGLPDLVISSDVWNPVPGQSASMEQILINKGNLQFADETDQRISEFPLSTYADHSPLFQDLDGSGAISIAVGDAVGSEPGVTAGAVMLNDGTGHFHLFLGPELSIWTSQINAFVASYLASLNATQSIGGFGFNQATTVPGFRAYETASHKLSYEVIVPVSHDLGGKVFEQVMVAVNLPVALDPNTDFTENVTVTVDPSSPKAHGWAGNDTFIMQSGSHTVDGGSGNDTAVFARQSSDYHVTVGSGTAVVSHTTSTGTDTDRLTNIEAVQFSDRTIVVPAPYRPATNPLVDAHEDALIDTSYYGATYPDVAAAGVDIAAHFTQFGWHEGRNPDAFFDVSYYLSHNPDIAAAGIDPLLHYALFGWREGRDPSSSFSTSKYLAANPDVNLAGINPLEHYLANGQAEGRSLGL